MQISIALLNARLHQSLHDAKERNESLVRVSLVINLSQVLFVVQAEGLSADESKARGVALSREVLDACAAAASEPHATDAAQQTRHAKLLAAHLAKLLAHLGRTDEAEALKAEHGLG